MAIEMKMSRTALEELTKDIEELKETAREAPIIVEGMRDERALKALGIGGEILKISNGLSIFEFCEDISKKYSSVILLTDLDKAGDKLTRQIKNHLSHMGIRVDERFKSIMKKLRTREVENIHGRLSKVKTF